MRHTEFRTVARPHRTIRLLEAGPRLAHSAEDRLSAWEDSMVHETTLHKAACSDSLGTKVTLVTDMGGGGLCMSRGARGARTPQFCASAQRHMMSCLFLLHNTPLVPPAASDAHGRHQQKTLIFSYEPCHRARPQAPVSWRALLAPQERS
jgi:hypothetical protein